MPEAKLFFDPGDFPVAEVRYNSVESDVDPAAEEFDRDLLRVLWADTCLLDLAWNGPRDEQPGEFTIVLVQNTAGVFEPVACFTCSSLEYVKSFTAWCAAIAAARP